MTERPYPEGIARDEALRQRQRAEIAEHDCAALEDVVVYLCERLTEVKWQRDAAEDVL